MVNFFQVLKFNFRKSGEGQVGKEIRRVINQLEHKEYFMQKIEHVQVGGRVNWIDASRCRLIAYKVILVNVEQSFWHNE